MRDICVLQAALRHLSYELALLPFLPPLPLSALPAAGASSRSARNCGEALEGRSTEAHKSVEKLLLQRTSQLPQCCLLLWCSGLAWLMVSADHASMRTVSCWPAPFSATSRIFGAAPLLYRTCGKGDRVDTRSTRSSKLWDWPRPGTPTAHHLEPWVLRGSLVNEILDLR